MLRNLNIFLKTFFFLHPKWDYNKYDSIFLKPTILIRSGLHSQPYFHHHASISSTRLISSPPKTLITPTHTTSILPLHTSHTVAPNRISITVYPRSFAVGGLIISLLGRKVKYHRGCSIPRSVCRRRRFRISSRVRRRKLTRWAGRCFSSFPTEIVARANASVACVIPSKRSRTRVYLSHKFSPSLSLTCGGAAIRRFYVYIEESIAMAARCRALLRRDMVTTWGGLYGCLKEFDF